MQTLVTGGTGLLGRALLKQLSNAIVTSRDPARATRELGAERAIGWDPLAGPMPLSGLNGVDAVFNLAGEPVAEGRWTEDKKRRIRDSRVLGTRNLVLGLRALERKPTVLISASAVGYYGDRGDKELTETSDKGSGFLAEVCAEWEQEARAAETFGVRVVCVRIGLVLAPNGGALQRMLPPFKLGLGARLGGGNHWMPWIHIEDVVGVLLRASLDTHERTLNAVSPQPVTNRDFTTAMAHAVNRPAALAVPKTALRLAFGQMSEILLASQRVLPSATQRAGYIFKYPNLAGALAAVISG